MPLTVHDKIKAANAVAGHVDIGTANELQGQGDLLLDLRDAVELQQTGRASGAHYIPRGILKLRAAETLPPRDLDLRKECSIILNCAAGACAGLAGKLLKDMGYARVRSLGGPPDWVKDGGEVSE